jgi:choline dehydrogenase-like flavoprotein
MTAASGIVDLSNTAEVAALGAGELVADVCIIGSGCGGATAAWELAKAGRHVVVLEEGGDFIGPALTGRDAAMYDQLYMDRGGRATDDLAISVLQGRVLGGGGVINACDVVPIADPVLRHWQKKYGLADFSPEALAPYKARAYEDLSANAPREDQVNANNALLRQGTQTLGWRGEIMTHNRIGCVGRGTCLLGCSYNAKRNPRFVAIPAAIDAGARFFLRARAVRIDDAGSETKTVRVRRLDAKGYHETGELTVRARIVILAANAVASAQLLLRSGIGNAHVGRHLSLQPQLPITAIFDRGVDAFRGIPQTWAVTEFERIDEDEGFWGFRIEAIGGTPGIVGSVLPQLGAQGKEVMTRFGHIASALLLVPDRDAGVVALEKDGRPRISYAMPAEQKKRYRDAARAAARLYLAAGASQVVVPVNVPVVIRSEADLAALDGLAFEPATTPFISAHQQGSVRFAPSEKDGAADPSGKVYGTRDVYVFDSSGFPSTSSSHTMTPILTVSRFLSAKLLAS